MKQRRGWRYDEDALAYRFEFSEHHRGQVDDYGYSYRGTLFTDDKPESVGWFHTFRQAAEAVQAAYEEAAE